MVSVIFSAVIYVLFIFLIYMSIIQPVIGKEIPSNAKAGAGIFCLLGAGLIVRMICASMYPGHETDINCFISWSDMIYKNGLANFYTSDAFTDYPPGYMYILYVLGFIKDIFNIQGSGLYLLIKMPAILCDCALTYIIYKKSTEHFSYSTSILLSLFILCSPAVLTNSALWGQVDSVFTLFIVLMVLCVMGKKMIPAYFLFAAGIFIKPQALIFTPVIIYGIVEHIFMAKKDFSEILKNLLFGLSAILAMLILSVPFGVGNVFDQYIKTLESYPYMTVNAFNIWGAFGQNWKELSTFANIASYIFMISIVAMTVPVFLKSKRTEKYVLIALLLSFGAFMLMTKMHERYAFPCLFLFMLLFIYKPDIHSFSLFTSASAMQFVNMAFVLFVYQTNTGKYYKSPIVVICSLLHLLVYCYMLWYSNNYIKDKTISQTKKVSSTKKQTSGYSFTKTTLLSPITRTDVIIMLIITAVYSSIALYDLGDKIAPETGMSAASIELELEEETTLTGFRFFTGSTHLEESTPLKIKLRNADGQKVDELSTTSGSVFAWHQVDIKNRKAKYIDITCGNPEYDINEIALMTEDNTAVMPKNSSEYSLLFDEQSVIPERISFRNGTYFDEIYHARTAYEFTQHDTVYEWTHPPLGKVLISIGISIFGMNPFGWRIVGTIFGIFMVPLMYVFAKRAFKYSWLAAVTCILFTFDFMHFAQTRIATIDVYVTFFIMLMYYFMFKYYNMSFYDTKLSKTFIPLGLCGITMGLAIASKWTGIYAAAGLAVLFFMTLYKRWAEYRYALSKPKGETDGISHKHVIDTFKSYTVKTIIFCCVFYIAIPVLIYCLSYIPYLQAPGMDGLKSIISNQKSMYGYHADLVAEHSFASEWYKWPIMYRPIWYYSGKISETLKEGISSFGNPAVWWFGIAAFGYQIYHFFKTRDKISLFLILSYMTQLIPWIPISRLTFIYHYFPSVPFVVLMIGYSLYHLYQTNPPTNKIINVRNICFAYALAAVALFAMFYPILSGMPIDPNFVETNLEWFSSWIFI